MHNHTGPNSGLQHGLWAWLAARSAGTAHVSMTAAGMLPPRIPTVTGNRPRKPHAKPGSPRKGMRLLVTGDGGA